MSTTGLTPAQWAKQRKAERLAAATAEAASYVPEEPLRDVPIEDTCCGKCEGTCYVDQVTGA